MSAIEVYRDAGDRPGAPLIEPLLGDEVLIERGRAELDRHAHQPQEVDLDVIFRAGLRLGDLCEIADAAAAGPRRGRLTGISLSFDGATIDCRLALEAVNP